MRTFIFFLACWVVAAQEKTPRKLIGSLDGKQLFNAYCATCHGMDGKGQGPVAAALKGGVPDLTTLTKRNKGKFPVADLEKMILGEGKEAAAHGSREMPVWGPLFRRLENDQDLGLIRARRLTNYIQTLQAK